VTVTAPVSGYIVDIPFKEGDIVHKGDLLFQIDPRPYQLTSRRLASCSRRKPISTAGCDVRTPTAFARDESYRERRLRYGFVQQEPSRGAGDLRASGTSPIDGCVSRQLVNIGNLVQADSTRLTTIVSIDPIYAYFSMDELAALTFQRLTREGKLASSPDGKVAVHLQLQDETGFPHEGTIDFSANTFDSSTGTLLIRASFPNTDGFLTPGNFVRVRVASSPKYDALLVADRAIGSDQDQSFVYVVDSKNIARRRHIKTGQLAEGLRVVKSGLQPDDVVIINGIIKVRPESSVKPQQGAMEQFSSNDTDQLKIKSSRVGADPTKATP
jgi:multidrug efflux pump subunit AcrA (membrane-fusion protein)